jgi:hypothetical protein
VQADADRYGEILDALYELLLSSILTVVKYGEHAPEGVCGAWRDHDALGTRYELLCSVLMYVDLCSDGWGSASDVNMHTPHRCQTRGLRVGFLISALLDESSIMPRHIRRNGADCGGTL